MVLCNPIIFIIKQLQPRVHITIRDILPEMHAKNKANPNIHVIIILIVRTNITKAIDKHSNRNISIPVSIIHVIESGSKRIEHRIEHTTKNRSIIIPNNINNLS